MLTKKDIKQIANLIAGQTCVQIARDNPNQYILKQSFVHGIAAYLESTNPRFDREKFYKACGWEEER